MKGHHSQLHFLSFLLLCYCETVYIKACQWAHVWWKYVCMFAHLNVYNLSHNMQLLLHLHTLLPEVMQETVVAQTNSSLSYWLSASHGQNQALCNNTPIKVWRSGSSVHLLGVKCVWFCLTLVIFHVKLLLYKKYNSCLTYKTNRSTVIAVLYWTNLFSTLICILWVQHLSHHHAVLFYCWHKEIQKHSLVTSLISPV